MMSAIPLQSPAAAGACEVYVFDLPFRCWGPLPLLIVLGCGDKDGLDDDSGATGTDTAADDTGESDETRTATVLRVGTAVAGTDTFTGAEEVQLLDDDEAGVCAFTVAITASGTRDDCADCDWAHDLTLSDTTVGADTDGACAALLGADGTALDGTSRAQGYQHAYLGHAEVIMVETDGAWAAAGYATWDEQTGAFSYEWESGTVTW